MRVLGSPLSRTAVRAGVVVGVSLCGVGAVASAARWTEATRNDALARAIVWQPPAVDVRAADLSRGPDQLPDELTCTFKMKALHGTARKFTCVQPDGQM